MIAVGLGLIGVVVGLIVTATPFSLFTFIGLISLAGIIVNNNIVLVDYTQPAPKTGAWGAARRLSRQGPRVCAQSS